jgi:hypothetical protein
MALAKRFLQQGLVGCIWLTRGRESRRKEIQEGGTSERERGGGLENGAPGMWSLKGGTSQPFHVCRCWKTNNCIALCPLSVLHLELTQGCRFVYSLL